MSLVHFLQKNPDYLSGVRRILEYEEDHKDDQHFNDLGWSWDDVRLPGPRLNQLVLAGIIEIVYKSRKNRGYLLVDREQIKKDLELYEAPLNYSPETDEEIKFSESIFDDIINYNEVKDLFKKALKSEEPIHILMIGPPASAKSMFLFCLARLDGAHYALGSSSTKSGLSDFLIEYSPRILLIDELDKMNTHDYSVLLSLCESGLVGETKYKRVRSVQLKCAVFAAANDAKKIPQEVKSRFIVLRFKEYAKAEFLETAVKLLMREGKDHDLATYIAEKIWHFEKHDIRDCIQISRLGDTKEEIDSTLKTLQKYS